MALKTLTNHRSSRIPQPVPGKNTDGCLPAEPFATITEESAGLLRWDDRPLYPAALREMSDLSDYRVALVPRKEWDDLRGPVEPDVLAASAVVLPCSWRELLAGISEFVRNSTRSAERRVAQFADIWVDFIKMEVCRVSGEAITLTRQEFKTLKCFLSNPDRVFSRDELLNEAWGYQNYPSTRTVDNHVLKLRQKLERDPVRPVHFLTVHSVGYKFVP